MVLTFAWSSALYFRCIYILQCSTIYTVFHVDISYIVDIFSEDRKRKTYHKLHRLNIGLDIKQ